MTLKIGVVNTILKGLHIYIAVIYCFTFTIDCCVLFIMLKPKDPFVANGSIENSHLNTNIFIKATLFTFLYTAFLCGLCGLFVYNILLMKLCIKHHCKVTAGMWESQKYGKNYYTSKFTKPINCLQVRIIARVLFSGQGL